MSKIFLKRRAGASYVALHRKLYKKSLIEDIKRQEPQTLLSLKTDKDYYLVEFRADDESEYFDFLNYLIFRSRSK